MLSATGLHILHDSGAPDGLDYTTLICVRGYGYHSGTFSRMLPSAHKFGIRLVLVNRGDYPGAESYSEEARRQLSPGTADPDALRSSMSRFMKDRALEFAAFLAELVQEWTIPPRTSLDKHWRRRPRRVVYGRTLDDRLPRAHILITPLRQYVRRIVIYGTPTGKRATPPLALSAAPADHDAAVPSAQIPPARRWATRAPPTDFDAFMLAMRGDRRTLTSSWLSGYFAHGRPLAVDTLEYRTPLAHPPPTLPALSSAERGRQNALAPVARGGSDQILAFDGYRCGLFREIWRRALYLRPLSPGPSPSPGAGGSDSELGAWDDVEVRHVWCDMAFWETPHAALMIQAELASAQARGARVRRVAGVGLRGVNHFPHWAHPERALQASLAEEHGPTAIESSARARL